MAKPCLTSLGYALSAELFRMPIPDSGYFSTTWLLKQVTQTNLSEQGKLLSAELVRDFLEVESKGYI